MIRAALLGCKPPTYPAGFICADGDSITFGYGLASPSTQNWFDVAMATLAADPAFNFTRYNSGVSSQTIGYPGGGAPATHFLTDVATEIDARKVAGAPRIKRSSAIGNIAILFGGTNDLYFGASQSDTLAYQQTWVTGRIAAGFKVGFGTMLRRAGSPSPPGTFETDRVALNAYWRTRGDVFLIDWCDDAAALSTGNTTYFQDGIHPTAALASIMATYAVTSIKAVLA